MGVIRTDPGKRHGRTFTLLVTILLIVSLLGSCSTDTSERDLAAQDKLVQLGNRLSAAHDRVVQARRLVKRERAAAARLARQGRRAASPRARRVVQTGMSLEQLCAPIKRRTSQESRRAARRHELHRKRTLYFLNLSCGPMRS